MTIALSIIFSEATLFAMASSSALLAEMALAMASEPLLFGFELVRPIGGERHGSRKERVGQQQLRVAHQRKRDRNLSRFCVLELDIIAFNALEQATKALASRDGFGRRYLRFMPGPFEEIVQA